MEITGTVEKVIRTSSRAGTPYLTVVIGGSRLTFLHSTRQAIAKGDTVTITGVPIVGDRKVNVGAARVTVH